MTRQEAQAAVLVEAGTFEQRTYPIPEIGPDDGLLRVELAGVCGTDLKILHGEFTARIGFPLIPGHEICGIVEEIGDAASERWGVSAGERVAVDSFLACGACDACLSGDTRYCQVLGDYGVSMSAARPPHLYGGFAEYLYLAPGSQVYRLPSGFSPALGVLVPAVVSNAIRWVSDAGGVRVGSTVLISGPGPIGLACVAVARELGASLVLVSGLPSDEYRLETARRLGADATLLAGAELEQGVLELTGGIGVDAVIDVSGSVQSLAAAGKLTRRQGTIVIGGMSGGRSAAIDPDDLALREISVQGVFSHDRSSIKRALRLVESGKYPFDDFVTHVFPLRAAAEAIEVVGNRAPSFLKSAIDPWLD